MSRVKRLRIANFRGATTETILDFQGRQSVVLIFGENGTGKSTIADAFDFLCNNEFGSLRLRKGVKAAKHVVAVEGSAQHLVVELEYGDHTWRARLKGQRPVTTPQGQPRAFVLRRADITSIMEKTDSERYKSLADFISVPQIERSESELRKAHKTAKAEVDQMRQQKQTADDTLRAIWMAEGCPGKSHLDWAHAASQQSVAELEQRIAANSELLSAIDHATAAQQALAYAYAKVQQLRMEYQAIQAELTRAGTGQNTSDLVETLEAAKAYLQQNPHTDRCPVCARPESRDALLDKLNHRLIELHALQELRNRLTRKADEGQQAKGAHAAAEQTWHAAIQSLQARIANTPEHPFGPFVADDLQDVARAAAILAGWSTDRQELEQRIAVDRKAVDQHHSLQIQVAAIDRLTYVTADTDEVERRLGEMLAIVELERKRFVRQTVDAIGESVAALYRRIHPDEPLGDPHFALKDHTQGSLTLAGRFGTQTNEPPGAYYSESHLDTLGLCVYLALAKQAGNALVILDDILMSVDTPHLDRIIDLINDEAPNFGQVIVTTHSRTWFDRVRMGQGMQAELIELYGWSLQGGMNHSAAPLAVDELREVVGAPKLDRQAVASRAAILLEQLLDGLTLDFACSLPRKRPAAYTLGELSGGIDKKLRRLLRTEHLDATDAVGAKYELYPLIQAAVSHSWIRNQVGAHFNPFGASISDAMVKQFAADVLALADAMQCPHCGQLPRKNKSGSYRECGGGCGRIRLYPLVSPD